MDGLGRLEALKTFILSLLAYKELHIYNTTITDVVKATEIVNTQKLSMDDAMQYASALSINAEAIISLDKHFDNLKIPRIEPQ